MINRKVVAAAMALSLVPLAASADQFVRGYMKRDGSYVQGYHRSTPNSTTLDNYSTQGNVNPYNGTIGTQPTYPTTITPGFTGPSSSTGRLRY